MECQKRKASSFGEGPTNVIGFARKKNTTISNEIKINRVKVFPKNDSFSASADMCANASSDLFSEIEKQN